MNELESALLDVVEKAAPTAPAVEVTEAALKTAAAPTPENMVADLELLISIAKNLKAELAGVHPSLKAIFKLLF